MGELAAKIQHNATLITKLEETEQLMAERDKSIQELCDKVEAKERLIKSRDEVCCIVCCNSESLTVNNYALLIKRRGVFEEMRHHNACGKNRHLLTATNEFSEEDFRFVHIVGGIMWFSIL